MDSKKASELFWVTFTGEFVEMVMKEESGDQGKLYVKGYLLDIDDIYYYLGAGPLEITGVVRKDLVAIINISKEIDPIMEVLENTPTPEAEEDIN